MRNVCFFNTVAFWGGGEKLHLEYALEFKKKGYNVFLVSKKDTPLAKKCLNYEIDVFPLSVGSGSFLNPVKLAKLVSFFRKKKIDTVIFSGSKDLKIGGIAAKWVKIPTVVYLRGIASPIRDNLLNRYLFSDVITHIVANSQATKDAILKNLIRSVNPEKVKVIYHGIELSRQSQFPLAKLATIEKFGKGIILGTAGRLDHGKGQEYLVEVAKILKETNCEFSLFIAGAGVLQDSLKALIRRYDLQHQVILLGFVEDIGSFMNSIDIFLFASESEGFGYALVEAMEKSKPIVAFGVTSVTEIVGDTKTGYLVDFPDVIMFAEKTLKLMANSTLRIQMGLEGRRAVIERFQLHDRIDEFEQYLLE